ncbi:MAG: hypothetical protein KF708_13635 [Pirellulales bacterium]|nr:hypothetical protein [Pirellulales bacterium]
MFSRWLAAVLLRPLKIWVVTGVLGWVAGGVPCHAQESATAVSPAGLKPPVDTAAEDSPPNPAPAGEGPSDEASAETTSALPKPTQQEAQAFFDSFKVAVASGEANRINGLFDWDAILVRGSTGIDSTKFDGPELLAKFRGIDGLVAGDAHPIIGEFGAGSTYKPLRVRYRAGRPELVCRLLFPGSGGVTYQFVPLIRRVDGAVLAGDLYLFSSGEYISETFHRYVLSSLARTNPDALSRTSAKDREFVRHLETCERMVQGINSGDHDDLLAAYVLLPSTLQREKPIFLLKLRSAPKLGLHGWQKTIDEARSLFPGDPTFDLQLMGDYNKLGKRDEALAAIERLEKSIGGDPFLLLLRGNLYLQIAQLGLAQKWIDNAILAEPGLVPARLSRINCALYQNDFAEVVKQLEALEGLGQQLADLTKVSGYKRFVASPEYRNWMQTRRKNAQAKAP